MAPTPTIERASGSDVDAIADMWVRLARDQRAYDSYVRPEANREAMRESLAAYAAADGLLVARVDGELAGFASVSIERGSLELDATRGTLSNLYVEPRFRDQGVGSALLEAAESTLEEKGAEVVVLEVMAANEDARRFYRRHGYDAFRVTMDRSLEE
ncbi:GNAT family N-acetyltransferase [Halopiger goleimassiliensis]|uniref:GNAT family N-acetyltransferase n=1 Tax=Halopiger goleimassiliensis TaxID=1293048 RepID=UPI000677FEA3|nr:GNAT family N-acetyltransferase [Halopiger goleimassiliensis]